MLDFFCETDNYDEIIKFAELFDVLLKRKGKLKTVEQLCEEIKFVINVQNEYGFIPKFVTESDENQEESEENESGEENITL